jgi:very-short-patch-repair endonuclease
MGKPSRRTVLQARELRRHSTPEEELLWQALRRKNLGYKIRRQHPLGTKIVDFYCCDARLAIEIDGIYHHDIVDDLRDAQLGPGVEVLRFTNEDVQDNVFDVIAKIKQALDRRTTPVHATSYSESPLPAVIAQRRGD